MTHDVINSTSSNQNLGGMSPKHSPTSIISNQKFQAVEDFCVQNRIVNEMRRGAGTGGGVDEALFAASDFFGWISQAVYHGVGTEG